jgi:hypothetical protein
MPKRATLTTRSLTSPTTASDQIPKNTGLVGSELDSNFLELRDQSIGVVADDSSTIDVKAGDTLYIQGGTNVTTSTNSDGSVTINSSGGSASTGNFTFNQSSMDHNGSFTIQSTATASTITIVAGTDGSDANSNILLDTRRIFTGQNNTNINIQAPGGDGDFTIANGGTTGSPAGFHNSIVLTDDSNGEITITPKTGKYVEIDGLRFPTADGTNGQGLVTNGSGVLSFANVGSAINIDGGTAASTYGAITALDGGDAT